MSDCDVAVVGAGIGGLSCALALKQVGCSVRLFERSNELRPIGGAILLRPRAVKILTNLGIDLQPGRLTGIVKLARVNAPSGYQLKSWAVPGEEARTLFVRRAALQTALVETVSRNGISLELNRNLASVTEVNNGVRLRFETGDQEATHFLVGADGVDSSVRRHLGLSMNRRYCGYVQWRCIVDAPGFLDDSKMEWWGKGLRFGVGKVGGGRIQWYASLSTANPEYGRDFTDAESLLPLFSGWDHLISRLIGASKGATLVWNPIFDRTFDPVFGRSHITLLGDAAHCMTPDLGLGGELAIEDAQSLQNYVARLHLVQKAFRNYELDRAQAVGRVIARSSRMGSMAQWRNPFAVLFRDAVIRLTPATVWDRMIRKGYGYDVDPRVGDA